MVNEERTVGPQQYAGEDEVEATGPNPFKGNEGHSVGSGEIQVPDTGGGDINSAGSSGGDAMPETGGRSELGEFSDDFRE